MSVFTVATIASAVVLGPAQVQAQWWRSAPKDFEDCADLAEKAATKEDKTSQLAECNAKFGGRRKPGGGYTYYDFLQDRSFDIAGPNPTPEEQKKIDQEYTRYLDKQRRDNILAALAEQQRQQQDLQAQRQQQQQPVQRVSLRAETEKVPVPVASPVKQAARIRAAHCAKDAFSCEWPRLSESLNELKKIFTPSSQPSAKNKQRS